MICFLLISCVLCFFVLPFCLLLDESSIFSLKKKNFLRMGGGQKAGLCPLPAHFNPHKAQLQPSCRDSQESWGASRNHWTNQFWNHLVLLLLGEIMKVTSLFKINTIYLKHVLLITSFHISHKSEITIVSKWKIRAQYDSFSKRLEKPALDILLALQMICKLVKYS